MYRTTIGAAGPAAAGDPSPPNHSGDHDTKDDRKCKMCFELSVRDDSMLKSKSCYFPTNFGTKFPSVSVKKKILSEMLQTKPLVNKHWNIEPLQFVTKICGSLNSKHQF